MFAFMFMVISQYNYSVHKPDFDLIANVCFHAFGYRRKRQIFVLCFVYTRYRQDKIWTVLFVY